MNEEGSIIELLARARHDAYLQSERRRGLDAAANSTLVPWNELPESLKESNRKFAESVCTKVRELGGRLVRAEPKAGQSVAEPLSVPAELMEALARREHDRWAEDLTGAGWKPSKGPKDADLRLHPMLIPWEELPEEEREKDRDSIRALPELLSAAGYTIEFGTA